MVINILILVILVLDFILNLTKAKKMFSEKKHHFELPYGTPTVFLMIVLPSLVYNYLIINGCDSITLQINLLGYILGVCAFLVVLPMQDKTTKDVVSMVIITILLNSLYSLFASNILYSMVSKNSLTMVLFIVVHIVLILVIHFKVFDIFSKSFVYSIYSNSKQYLKFVNALTYLILIFSMSKLSVLQYKDNTIKLLNKYSSSSIGTFQTISDSNDGTYTTGTKVDNVSYTPLANTANNAIYISEDLTPLDSNILSEIVDSYEMPNVNAKINDYTQGTSDLELLNYIQSMDCYHNPFYTARKLISDYLDTSVTPSDFNTIQYEDCSNNLMLDYTQYDGETCEDYAKRVHSTILNQFCPSGLDLFNVEVGDSNDQKYIFSIYYNELTQTYDILCLFFKYDYDIVTNINYDLVSISKEPIPVYSNYFDILPTYDNASMVERYQEYNISDNYYVMFKYYNLST